MKMVSFSLSLSKELRCLVQVGTHFMMKNAQDRDFRSPIPGFSVEP
jgi:hypothetical protein